MLTLPPPDALLDRVGLVVVVLDAEGRIRHMNAHCEAVTGYRLADVEGRFIWDVLLVAGQVETYRQQYGRLRNSLLPDGYDTWWRAHDGTERLIRWTNHALAERGEGSDHIVVAGIDATRTRRDEAQLQHLAYHDELTGLWNRRRFNEGATLHLAQVARSERPAALLAIDVDGLKAANDELGHAAGDAVLQHVASVLQERLRLSDMVARTGGDEFATLLPATDIDRAAAVGRDLIRSVAAHEASYDGTSIPVRISVGAAPMTGASSLREVLAMADRALYGAKRDGGHAVRTHLPPLGS